MSTRNAAWMTQVSGSGDSVLVWGGGTGPSPGHYSGLTADAHGAFRPFWVDARSGLAQLYTTTLWVEGTARPARPLVRSTTVSTGGFRVEFERARYDSATSVFELPVRVRNLTGGSLYAPLWLTATILSSPSAPVRSTLVSFLNGERPTRVGPRTTAIKYDLGLVMPRDGILLANEPTTQLVMRFKTNGRPLGRLVFALTAATATAETVERRLVQPDASR